MKVCRICGNADRNARHVAQERMLGYGDAFEYLECSVCGCLQIKEIPEDLSRYYPPAYYSFERQQYSGISRYLRLQRTAYKLYGTNLIGKWMSRIAGDYSDLSYRKGWFSKAGISKNSRILDVGCGSGKLLRRLGELGFTELTGVDPFIEQDIRTGNLVIHKKHLSELHDQFDFVMLHHSFEHMPAPLDTLKQIRRLLNPGSHALIRIPVAAHAWRVYGVDWVQLDAPRHLHLHTTSSLQLLALQAGLEVVDTVFDSTSYQFVGSEENIRRRSSRVSPGRAVASQPAPLTRQHLRQFRRQSHELNAAGAGDQACFYLRN